MEEILYQNTLVQRGTAYIIRILKRNEDFLVSLSLDNGEKFREFIIIIQVAVDKENFSAAAIFREVIESEERWIADNR